MKLKKVKKCDDDTRWLSDFRDITRELILIQFPWKTDKDSLKQAEDILKKLKTQVRRISGTISGLKEDIAMRERLEKLK